MDRFTSIYAPIVGRILMGGFFLWDGIESVLNFPATTEFLSSLGFFGTFGWLVAILSVTVEVLAGICLIVGYQPRTSAVVLALYTLLVSPLFLLDTTLGGVSLQLFLQNMAIVGGLLYIAAYEKSPQ